MRKLLSILFIVVILLAGMHLTVATHFCRGNIAAIKVTLSGNAASCGMPCDAKSNSSSETHITSNCCKNEYTVYAVDNNFAPSEFNSVKLIKKLTPDFIIPIGYTFQNSNLSVLNAAHEIPPGNFPASAVSLAGICVFRI